MECVFIYVFVLSIYLSITSTNFLRHIKLDKAAPQMLLLCFAHQEAGQQPMILNQHQTTEQQNRKRPLSSSSRSQKSLDVLIGAHSFSTKDQAGRCNQVPSRWRTLAQNCFLAYSQPFARFRACFRDWRSRSKVANRAKTCFCILVTTRVSPPL